MAPGADASVSRTAPLSADMRSVPVPAPAPALARPDLVGAFDPAAYQVDQFDFGPKPELRAGGGSKFAAAAAKKPNMERVKRARRVKECSVVRFDDEGQRAALEDFKEKARKTGAVVVQTPRKKAATVDPALRPGEEAEFDEDPVIDSYVDIAAAKASIRNHLMENSPVHTAATKRRVNGLARNWIRAHKDDPDVKYLLSFPGEMSLERCLDILGRRDMLSLDPVEEANGSLVMPAENLPAANLTSEASRQQKLDLAQKQLEETTVGDLSAILDEAEANGSQEDPEDQEEVESGPARVFAVPSSFIDTTIETGAAPSVAPTSSPQSRSQASVVTDQPQTPPVRSSQEILDVDLNQNPDIFASAMPPRRRPEPSIQAPAPAAPVWSPTTPQAPQSPTHSLDVDAEEAGQWSPLASTPGLASSDDTMDVQPESPTAEVELPENPTFVFGEVLPEDHAEPAASSVDALADLVSPIRELPDSRVVMQRHKGRFVVRFKLPEEYADAFSEDMQEQPETEPETEPEIAEPEVVPEELSIQEQDIKALQEQIIQDIISTEDRQSEHKEDEDERILPIGDIDDVTAVPEVPVSWAYEETPQVLVVEAKTDELADAQQGDTEVAHEEMKLESMEEAETEEEDTVADEFDRDYLRQFMTKHQAGKAKASATPPAKSSKLAAPDTAPSVASPSPAPGRASSAPVEVPRTPEDAPAPRMWVETPTFTLASEGNVQESPVRSVNSARSRSSSGLRRPLGELDSNSPSPVKAKGRKRKHEEPIADPQPDKENANKHEKKKDGKPKNNNDDIPDKADKTPEPSPSPKRRRGLRARRPVAPPTPIPATARAVRSGEKDLASLTRANTRANKGNASMPQEVLDRFAADPIGQKWKERKEVVDAKAARAESTKPASKNVRWAETLAEYEDNVPPVASADTDMKDEEPDPIAVGPGEEDDIEDEPVEAQKLQQQVKAAERPKPKRGRPVGSTVASRAASASNAGSNKPVKTSSSSAAKATPAKTSATAATKPAQRSKLPAPVGRSRTTTPEGSVGHPASNSKKTATKMQAPSATSVLAPKNEGSKVAKTTGRPTRAAAQKSNLGMGLTATGTPIPKGRRGRSGSED